MKKLAFFLLCGSLANFAHALTCNELISLKPLLEQKAALDMEQQFEVDAVDIVGRENNTLKFIIELQDNYQMGNLRSFSNRFAPLSDLKYSHQPIVLADHVVQYYTAELTLKNISALEAFADKCVQMHYSNLYCHLEVAKKNAAKNRLGYGVLGSQTEENLKGFAGVLENLAALKSLLKSPTENSKTPVTKALEAIINEENGGNAIAEASRIQNYLLKNGAKPNCR